MFFKLNQLLQSLEQVMMTTREPLEWHFKQLDHAVGLRFFFNFCLIAYFISCQFI